MPKRGATLCDIDHIFSQHASDPFRFSVPPAPPASEAGKARQRQAARHVSDTQYRDRGDRIEIGKTNRLEQPEASKVLSAEAKRQSFAGAPARPPPRRSGGRNNSNGCLLSQSQSREEGRVGYGAERGPPRA